MESNERSIAAAASRPAAWELCGLPNASVSQGNIDWTANGSHGVVEW
jgi:hypothetical protein